MVAHITVVPASTQAGKETIRLLLESKGKPVVRGIYRDPSKAPVEFTRQPDFEAVQGDVATGTGLDFSTSNAVFYIPPPTYDGTYQGEFATRASLNVKNALQRAPSVKRLVLHSSMGAQYDHGIGVLRLNHIADRILRSAASEVVIVKPGYYYENWLSALKSMKEEPPSFESPISPPDYKIPMVSVRDVGEYCAEALLDKSTRPAFHCIDVFGPRLYSSLDVKRSIEEVTGKDGTLVTIEKDKLVEYFAHHVPEVYAQEFADMVTAMLPGGIMAGDFEPGENSVRGKLELGDVLRHMLSLV
ncbi:hypothetical protein F5X96DRAFT_680750 [Biscogniauxia mediterranea]|nr:hypothetical protein F5X96DRAFT_680750 [Biscogniauxia mediterranea]